LTPPQFSFSPKGLENFEKPNDRSRYVEDTVDAGTNGTEAVEEVLTSPQAQEVKTFTEATQAFLQAMTDLTDADLPMKTAMQQAAKELDDKGVQAALLNQYRQAFLALTSKRDNGAPAVDEDDVFLNGA
jgi:hypothetical protein